MSDGSKIRSTGDSASISNVAYKPSWREKLPAKTPIFRKLALSHPEKPSLRTLSMICDRFAARYRASLTDSSLRLHSNYGELALPSF